MKFSEIRNKYSEYDHLSDQQLADALHKKFYPQLSKPDFFKRIGFKSSTQKPIASEPFDWEKSASNIPESAVQLGKDIVYPIMNPVQTGKAVGGLGQGLWQKFLGKDPFHKVPVSQQQNVQMVDAVKEMYGERYGDWEKTKRTLEKDPLGGIADAATILTGGGAAAARLPGLLGKVGRTIQKTGRAIDPINIPFKAAGGVAKGAGAVIPAYLGTFSGSGIEAIREAGKAGRESMFNLTPDVRKTIEATKAGRARAKTFLEHLRGRADLREPLEMAQKAFKNLVKGRGAGYKKGMAEIASNKKVIDFGLIDKAIEKVSEAGKFKGVDVLEPSVEAVSEVNQKVARWKALDPVEFHTAEGLDQLKKSIGLLLKKHKPDSAEWVFVKRVYDGVWESINNADPKYAKFMADYAEATEVLTEIKKSLSVGAKTSNVDAAIRKLTSIMRNNVSTNFGYRKLLAEKLVEAGADRLFPAIAGHTLSPVAPIGIARSDMRPWKIPMTSPRGIGEAAYYAGKASAPFVPVARGVAKGAVPTARGLLQAGRIGQEAERRGLLNP
ncbi:hypothetical protein [uncultured Mediterranean phage uvDeep-CGR0-AD1-C123]|nr:hypothetical protein [uncultured Mediterranean phage uvDeep-CGR0-AD1-C123]